MLGLASSVVPWSASFAACDRLPRAKNRLTHKAEPFTARIKPNLAGRGQHGMAIQYDDFPALFPRELVQFFAEIDFFRRK